MIKVEPVSRSVTVVRFDHGPVSALDLEFLLALRAELAALAETDAALVLTGTGPAFSAGVDLVRLIEGGPGYVADFIPTLAGAFADIFAYQRPVVAAVNGHAIAGGGGSVSRAQHPLKAGGRGRIGVPELLVGAALPAVGLLARGFPP